MARNHCDNLFHQTGIEAQDGLLTMTYDGPRLDPVAVTMTMMSFIKHIQNLPDVGYLIDVEKPIQEHVPTNSPHYAKHAAEANDLQKKEGDTNARPIPSFGRVSTRARAAEESEDGDEEVDPPAATHMDGAVVNTLAAIVIKDKKADIALGKLVDEFTEEAGTSTLLIYKNAKVHPSSPSGIQKLQALFAHWITSKEGKRRVRKEFDRLEQEDSSLKDFIEEFNCWEEFFTYASIEKTEEIVRLIISRHTPKNDST